MPSNFQISSLMPSGLTVERIARVKAAIVLTVRAAAYKGICPLCQSPSRRVHSRYVRRVSDLPCSGHSVHLRVVTRRFVCEVPHCRRRIFAERFDEAVLGVRSRRTTRLDCLVHYLGLALGGRPAASFARRLMLPVSNDTLLRVVRRRACRPAEPVTVAGIDDWAFRRNHRYGTIVCDLERRRVVTLLPDREIATVEAWLAHHPQIRIVSRDRGGGYGEATTKALPNAIQVADRWHLMENASSALLDAIHKSMRSIRYAIGAPHQTDRRFRKPPEAAYQKSRCGMAKEAFRVVGCHQGGTAAHPRIAGTLGNRRDSPESAFFRNGGEVFLNSLAIGFDGGFRRGRRPPESPLQTYSESSGYAPFQNSML
jgi:transposase